MRTTIKESFEHRPPVAPQVVGKPRRIANNTFKYATEDGREVIRLHMTDIVEYLPEGKVRLNSGGWKTVTTKARIDDAISSMGYRIWSNKGIWFVGTRDDYVPFEDGMILPDAIVELEQRNKAYKSAQAQVQLKAKIKAFVTKTLPSDKPIPVPNDGDCWYCLMFDREEPAGECGFNGYASARPTQAQRDNSHLLAHIEEGYMTGSLVINSMRCAGLTDAGIRWIAYSDRPDYTRIRRMVRRYLQFRLGLTY